MAKTGRTGRPRGRRPYVFNSEVALQARLALGLTQTDLSDRCEALGGLWVYDSNISRYERGEGCPGPRTLRALAAGLELTVDDLITLTPRKPQKARAAA